MICQGHTARGRPCWVSLAPWPSTCSPRPCACKSLSDVATSPSWAACSRLALRKPASVGSFTVLSPCMEKQPPLRRQEESGRFVPTCQGPGLRPTTEQSDLPWDRDAGRGTPSPFPHHTWDTLWEEGEKGGHTQALEPWRWGGRGRGSVLSPLPATAPTPHSGAEVTAAGDPLGWEQCEDRVSHVEGLQKHLRSSFGGVGVG